MDQAEELERQHSVEDTWAPKQVTDEELVRLRTVQQTVIEMLEAKSSLELTPGGLFRFTRSDEQ